VREWFGALVEWEEGKEDWRVDEEKRGEFKDHGIELWGLGYESDDDEAIEDHNNEQAEGEEGIKLENLRHKIVKKATDLASDEMNLVY